VNPDFSVVVLQVVLDEVVLHVDTDVFLHALSVLFLELVGMLQQNVSKDRVYTENHLESDHHQHHGMDGSYRPYLVIFEVGVLLLLYDDDDDDFYYYYYYYYYYYHHHHHHHHQRRPYDDDDHSSNNNKQQHIVAGHDISLDIFPRGGNK